MRASFHLSFAICLITAIGWWFAAASAGHPARRPTDIPIPLTE